MKANGSLDIFFSVGAKHISSGPSRWNLSVDLGNGKIPNFEMHFVKNRQRFINEQSFNVFKTFQRERRTHNTYLQYQYNITSCWTEKKSTFTRRNFLTSWQRVLKQSSASF